MRSIEIIQKTGPNALVYGNDSALPGEHIKVFSGEGALERAETWTLVHHPDGPCFSSEGLQEVSDWNEVTCKTCKLERPIEPAKEYEIPEHVLKTDAALSLADRSAAREPGEFLASLAHVAMWQRRLAKLRALEEGALDLAAHWARTVKELTAVREATEKALSAALSGQESSGKAGAGSAGSEAQRGAQGATEVIAWQDVRTMRDRIPTTYGPTAPVNAVDIRTDAGQDEGMTNTETQLSERAKSALMSSKTGLQGSKIAEDVSIAVRQTLYGAGLIGSLGHLTRAGAIAREQIVAELEEDAFGPLP